MANFIGSECRSGVRGKRGHCELMWVRRSPFGFPRNNEKELCEFAAADTGATRAERTAIRPWPRKLRRPCNSLNEKKEADSKSYAEQLATYTKKVTQSKSLTMSGLTACAMRRNSTADMRDERSKTSERKECCHAADRRRHHSKHWNGRSCPRTSAWESAAVKSRHRCFRRRTPFTSLLFGLVFTAIWYFSAARGLDPARPSSLRWALLSWGLDFVVLWYGAQYAADNRGSGPDVVVAAWNFASHDGRIEPVADWSVDGDEAVAKASASAR